MVAMSPACLRLGGFLTLVLTLATTAALYLQPVLVRHNLLNRMKNYNLDWKLWTLQSRVKRVILPIWIRMKIRTKKGNI